MPAAQSLVTQYGNLSIMRRRRGVRLFRGVALLTTRETSPLNSNGEQNTQLILHRRLASEWMSLTLLTIDINHDISLQDLGKLM